MNQKKIKLTPEQKLNQSLKLYSAAKELKTAALRKFYPELTETEIIKKVKDIFLYART
jgi:hypothetical protein